MGISGIDWMGRVPESGTHTVTTAEAGAGSVAINIGSGVAAIARVLRSGSDATADAAVSIAAGVLTIADGSTTYNTTAGDVIRYIVF